MRFIVTRPAEDAAKLVKRLEALGHSALAEPMIQIVNLADVCLPAANWQAVLVTSANSIRALSALEGKSKLTTTPVLAVGPASARAAQAAGFQDVTSADGDLKALTRLAAQRLVPDRGPVFYPSGTVVSGDLKAQLEEAGFSCTRLPLYEAVPSRVLSNRVVSELNNHAVDGVLLFSPRSAKIWAKCLITAGLVGPASSLTHCCLSNAVADALQAEGRAKTTFKNILIPPEPNEDSLLNAVGAS